MKALICILSALCFCSCKLAAKLRLLVPLLYVLIAGTIFHEWATANEVLAIGILVTLVLISLGSWAITAIKKV